MATLMDYIVAQSTLPVGNTIRDHIENPATMGSGGGGFIYSKEVIQVSESEILKVTEREAVVVSEPVVLKVETERILLTNEQSEIIEVN